ncbi:MAG: hypothetical protein JSS61_03770 [Verrucomicrobia bacterium]|nr:hypothetical protein [Verrucomicrobiota bacterium]
MLGIFCFVSAIFYSFLCYGHPIPVPLERYKNCEELRSHPGHYPFISYLTYRNICDHIIDQSSTSFDPATVQKGDTIYLNGWYIEWFVNEVHDQIEQPYILLISDIGNYFPDQNCKKLLYDPKLAAWFCRNMIFCNHPKLIQIPMGQDLALFCVNPIVLWQLLNEHSRKPLPKEHWLHMCFYPRPFGDRDQIWNFYLDKPFSFHQALPNGEYVELSRHVYYEDMLKSRFTLSPIGLENDCVRTWEALVLDCIPIIEHSFIDPLFDGLPVVKVDNWFNIDQPMLEKEYNRLSERFASPQMERCYFDYWARKIRDTQKKVRSDTWRGAELEATLFSDEDLRDLSILLTSGGRKCPKLVYLGSMTTLRSLQLANELPFLETLYLADQWLDLDSLHYCVQHIRDHNLFENAHKIACVSESDPVVSPEIRSTFLDLTHLAHSIPFNFQRIRQSLRSDLEHIYNSLEGNAFLCGNRVQDEYVQKVLNQLSQERSVTIHTHGNFWFLHKP